MAYRNDVEALQARPNALQSDLDGTTRERDAAARLLAEARARAETEGIAADWAAGGPQRRRQRTVRITVLATLLCTFTGAGIYGIYRYRSADDHHFDKVMKVFEGFADKMCGCKDRACAEKVSEEMTRWAQDMAKEQEPKPPRMSEEETRRATKVGERMGECMSKAMTPPEPTSYGAQLGGQDAR